MPAGGFVGSVANGPQERSQRLHVLQQAQPRSIGRAHVDHQVIGCRCQATGTDQVVLGSVVQINQFGLADVHPNNRPDVRVQPLQSSPR
ncbi:hypothetical protein D3C73_1160010 [compost metagenome]